MLFFCPCTVHLRPFRRACSLKIPCECSVGLWLACYRRELTTWLTTERDVSNTQGECTSLPVAEPGTTALGTAKYNMTCYRSNLTREFPS